MITTGIVRAFTPIDGDAHLVTVAEQKPNGADGASHSFQIPTEMLDLDPEQPNRRTFLGTIIAVETDATGAVTGVDRGAS
ncbi:MAG: hypothetical protein AB7T06_40410 [Kofleriaceae bacterium]